MSLYDGYLPGMLAVQKKLTDALEATREQLREQTGMDPVEHLLTRIKSEESMLEKCARNALEPTAHSALFVIHDAIGVRVVCAFLSDVYRMRDAICAIEGIEIVKQKDYIRQAKPNGYRSYHLIVRLDGFFAEIQLRTISMDTWAALEHHIKYKKNVYGSETLIIEELKRCADELASTDVSMQTLRDMILAP